MWPDGILHIDKGWNETVEFHVWPGEEGSAELYEDDGDTLAYRGGVGATTSVRLATAGCWPFRGRRLAISPRQGAFGGMNAKRSVRVVWHAEDGETSVQSQSAAPVADELVFSE